jgi:hypothetical protein
LVSTQSDTLIGKRDEYFSVTPLTGHLTMADAIVRYPARGQAPEIYATQLNDELRAHFEEWYPAMETENKTSEPTMDLSMAA